MGLCEIDGRTKYYVATQNSVRAHIHLVESKLSCNSVNHHYLSDYFLYLPFEQYMVLFHRNTTCGRTIN